MKNLKALSPKGDIGKNRAEISARLNKIKSKGKAESALRALPYHKPEMAIDHKYGPGDSIA